MHDPDYGWRGPRVTLEGCTITQLRVILTRSTPRPMRWRRMREWMADRLISISARIGGYELQMEADVEFAKMERTRT